MYVVSTYHEIWRTSTLALFSWNPFLYVSLLRQREIMDLLPSGVILSKYGSRPSFFIAVDEWRTRYVMLCIAMRDIFRTSVESRTETTD